MPFTDTCKDIRIDAATGILHAQCKTSNGSWKPATLSLDTVIGNKDGAFAWGSKDWSRSARNWKYDNGFLSAELKTPKNEWVPCKLDLNSNIANNNGVLIGVNLPSLNGVLQVDTHSANAQASMHAAMASSASTASSFTSSSASSIRSSSTSATSVQSTETVSYKSEKILFISLTEARCKLYIEGAVLHAEYQSADGIIRSSLNLNLYIGNVNGVLQWEKRDFSLTSWDIKIEEITKLVATCRLSSSQQTVRSVIDLAEHIFICHGRLYFRESNRELSVALSEVPWMKFRVVAEPDFSVLYANAAIRGTMTKIAETTVQHVTMEMSRQMTFAIQEAVNVVTASAMQHISTQMSIMLADISGVAHIERSCSESSYLRTMSLPLPPLTSSFKSEELSKLAPPKYELPLGSTMVKN